MACEIRYSESFRMEFVDWMMREHAAHLMNFWIIANEFQLQAAAKDPAGKLAGDPSTLLADAEGL